MYWNVSTHKLNSRESPIYLEEWLCCCIYRVEIWESERLNGLSILSDHYANLPQRALTGLYTKNHNNPSATCFKKFFVLEMTIIEFISRENLVGNKSSALQFDIQSASENWLEKKNDKSEVLWQHRSSINFCCDGSCFIYIKNWLIVASISFHLNGL